MNEECNVHSSYIVKDVQQTITPVPNGMGYFYVYFQKGRDILNINETLIIECLNLRK